jgi:hypothetical protein
MHEYVYWGTIYDENNHQCFSALVTAENITSSGRSMLVWVCITCVRMTQNEFEELKASSYQSDNLLIEDVKNILRGHRFAMKTG